MHVNVQRTSLDFLDFLQLRSLFGKILPILLHMIEAGLGPLFYHSYFVLFSKYLWMTSCIGLWQPVVMIQAYMNNE